MRLTWRSEKAFSKGSPETEHKTGYCWPLPLFCCSTTPHRRANPHQKSVPCQLYIKNHWLTNTVPASPLNPIPVRPKLRRRFFEAVKFEEALSRACELDPISLGRVSVDPPHDPSDDAEQAYKSYVNKLAHVCDTKRGGTTVTGVAILQDVDRVIYVIGSNERSPADLADLVQFVNSLFDLAQSAQFTDIFHHILKHNRPRIRSYLSRMPDEIDKCVASLSNMPVQARRAVGPGERISTCKGLRA